MSMNIVCLDLEGVLVPEIGSLLLRRAEFWSSGGRPETSRIMIN